MYKWLLGIYFFLSVSAGIAGQLILNPDSINKDTLLTPEELMLLDLPEICPPFDFLQEIYCPDFLLSSSYFKARYQEKDLLYKIVDNKGNGFDNLYGTRNLRPILHGVAYRGGGNNYYHKENKRKNSNPLPNDGVDNLCKEGFSNSIYLYRTNWESAKKKSECKCVNNSKNNLTYSQYDYFEESHVYEMMKLVYESATDKHSGPVYLHCWNGWHASGYMSAIILKQFCGYSDLNAISYWDLCTDGTNTSPRYNSIREKIKAFTPYPEFILKDSIGNKICPPMPEIIDSSHLYISVEHLLMVPEALPLGTVLILNHIKFQPNKTTLTNPESNEDLVLLLKALQKSTEISLEISGHTDRSGNENTNKTLSKERAQFVYQHLKKNGIAENRLTFLGYGSSRPAYTNKTKSGRAANRRIEIKITGKSVQSFDKLVTEESSSDKKSTPVLKQLDIGESLILKRLIFNPSEATFGDAGKLQLDSLCYFLTENQTPIIEIIGYTDLSGIEDHNITLSVLRSKAVYDYLVKKGIDPKRLFYSGCGSENPIAPNKYKWGRDINRRIEIVILSK